MKVFIINAIPQKPAVDNIITGTFNKTQLKLPHRYVAQGSDTTMLTIASGLVQKILLLKKTIP